MIYASITLNSLLHNSASWHVWNILKAIKNATGVSVVFLINMSVIHFDYVSTSLPFLRECYCKNWTRLHTSAKFLREKWQIHQKNLKPSLILKFYSISVWK